MTRIIRSEQEVGFRPSVFIGNSKEASQIAKEIQSILEPEINAKKWDDGIFELGEDNLTNLIQFTRYFDFGVLVLKDDDQTVGRDGTQDSPRDNVIFELGLFIGALGRRRGLAVIVPGKANTLKLPTDILGNSAVFLDRNEMDNDPSYFRRRINEIKRTIMERSKDVEINLPSAGLAMGYYKNLLRPVCKLLSSDDDIVIDGKARKVGSAKYDFRVVVPTALRDASVPAAGLFAKAHNLVPVKIKLPNRDYSFASAPEVDGRLQLYDFATPLSASFEAVDAIFRMTPLGTQTVKVSEVQEKEIRSYVNALKNQLENDQDSVTFKFNVEVVYMAPIGPPQAGSG